MAAQTLAADGSYVLNMPNMSIPTSGIVYVNVTGNDCQATPNYPSGELSTTLVGFCRSASLCWLANIAAAPSRCGCKISIKYCRLAPASGVPENLANPQSGSAWLSAAHTGDSQGPSTHCQNLSRALLTPAYAMPIGQHRARREAQPCAATTASLPAWPCSSTYTDASLLEHLSKNLLHASLLSHPHPAAAQRHGGCSGACGPQNWALQPVRHAYTTLLVFVHLRAMDLFTVGTRSRDSRRAGEGKRKITSANALPPVCKFYYFLSICKHRAHTGLDHMRRNSQNNFNNIPFDDVLVQAACSRC